MDVDDTRTQHVHLLICATFLTSLAKRTNLSVDCVYPMSHHHTYYVTSSYILWSARTWVSTVYIQRTHSSKPRERILSREHILVSFAKRMNLSVSALCLQCVCVRVCVCACVRVCVCVSVRGHTYTSVLVCLRVRACTHARALPESRRSEIHTHTHTHTPTHTHQHTHTHTSLDCWGKCRLV